MIMQPSLLARKYASAYLNYYGTQWSLDVYKQVAKLADFLQENPVVVEYLTMASTSPEMMKNLFEQLITRFNLPSNLIKLFNLIWRHKRQPLLSQVTAALCYEYRKMYGIEVWTVSSSHFLTDGQIESIKQDLARRTGKTIEIKTKQDKQLIAGIRLQSDTLAFEHSISKQLHAVRALEDIR
jgi:F-type H+-transporting ATPase subunit delta